MSEKRLSIRFRMDNPQDKEMSVNESNVSFTSIAKDEPQTDEYRAVSKEALSFLDEF